MKNSVISIISILFAGLVFNVLAADTPSTPTPTPRLSAFDLSMAAGRAAVKNKNYELAITSFTEAVKQNQRSADAHTMLGYSYRVQATPNLSKSFEHYDLALAIDPNHKGANEYAGQAHLMGNNIGKARQHLAQLEKICGKQCPEYKNLEAAILNNQPNNNSGY